MLGIVGTLFGKQGVNIDNAVIGAGKEGSAVLAITSQNDIPQLLIDEILQLEGFQDGHVVSF
jgi:predicted regulator of amino acid metabolism with ACT domain